MDVAQPAPPKARNYTPMIIFVVALLIIAGLVYYFFFTEEESEEDQGTTTTTPGPAPPVEEDAGVDDVSGLAARYTRDTYDSETNTWKDTKGGNAFTVSGALTAPTDENYLTGTTVTKFTLPSTLYDRTYTVFTVAKYNGENKKRIFTSSEGDWYSGHNAAMSGVAKHDDLLTEEVDRYGSGWVVSCDQRDLYRANGTRLSGLHHTQGLPTDMGVNISVGEESEFALGEIIVFSRALSTSEIEIVEKVLMDKYVIRPNEYFTATLTNNFVTDIYDAEVDCGPRGALNTLSVAKHSELEKHRYQYKCMMELDPYDNDEYEERTIFQEREPSYMENVMMDCNLNPVRGFKTEMSENNKTRFVFKCSSGTVDEATCVQKNSQNQPLSDLTAHDVNCGEDGEVVTSIRFRKDDQDATKGRYEFTCCKPKGY
jgi:hypothetical protein